MMILKIVLRLSLSLILILSILLVFISMGDNENLWFICYNSLYSSSVLSLFSFVLINIQKEREKNIQD
ncbi:MAG: hypothetical protein FJZ43_01175 [Candidatus Staskawiczbacteria bacterium]|nr:hypothetical protein [Candidatus Staskawiczbacteria bacterium]